MHAPSEVLVALPHYTETNHANHGCDCCEWMHRAELRERQRRDNGEIQVCNTSILLEERDRKEGEQGILGCGHLVFVAAAEYCTDA